MRLSALIVVAILWIPLARAQDVQPPPQTLTPEQRAARVDDIRQSLVRVVTDLDKRIAKGDGKPTLRDLPNAALAKLVLGHDPREAENLLKLAFDQQDMDPKSSTYGSVPWQIGHPEISDANSDEFTSAALGPILLQFGDKLSADFKAALRPHATAFFAALNRRAFRTPAYTNIYLMRAVNMILLGEGVADAPAADEGYRQLEQWIDYTKKAGIREFDSPTYYSVDLDSLAMGYAYAARPGARQKFKAILDYFWADIAANYFVSRGCLSGPASRNYDFLSSYGGMDLWLYLHGFRATRNIPRPDLEKVYLVTAPPDKTYVPGPEIFALTALKERIVQSRFDLDPQRDRYHFLTPDFAIGSANGDYTAHDKLLTIELASAKKIPVITVVPDLFDAPYGKAKTLDKSGHSKPTHLKLYPTIVQQKGMMLALLDLDPSAEKKEIASLATNILLPANADSIMLDGRKISPQIGMDEPATLNGVIGVREGHAAAVIRIFRADACAGSTPMFSLKADEIGVKENCFRLAVDHYAGPAKLLEDKHIRVGILMMAAECRSDADLAKLIAAAKAARIEQHDMKKAWEVKATLNGTTLEAGHDLANRGSTFRQVDGKNLEPHALMINGDDWAAKIWAAINAPDKK